MRRALYLVGLMGCVLLASSIYLWGELNAERASNTQLRARLEAAQRRTAIRIPHASPPTTVKSKTQPAAAAASSPAAAPTSQPATSRKEDWEAYQRRMMRDARYREVQREQTRLALALRRANLIRLLGMTPAQADAVIDLQIEHEWQQSELMNNLPAEEQRQQQQRADAQEAAYQARLRELLGEDKQRRLGHYMETRQSRMQVDTFRTQLNGVDSLRDDQVEPLIEALHVEREKMQGELERYGETLRSEGESNDTWQRYGERQIELMKDMHAGMHSSAAAVLTSPQLEQLDAMLNRELQRHEANMRMSKLQSKLETATADAPPN